MIALIRRNYYFAIALALLLGREALSADVVNYQEIWNRIPRLTSEQKTKINDLYTVPAKLAGLPDAPDPFGFVSEKNGLEGHLQALMGRDEIHKGSVIMSLLTKTQKDQAIALWKDVEQTATLDQLAALGQKQISSELCWAACVQAVLLYNGIQATQRDIASQVMGSVDNIPVSMEALSKKLSSGTYYQGRGVAANLRTFSAHDQIVDYLRGRGVLLMAVEDRHLVVVTGIKWKGLSIAGAVTITALSAFDPAEGKVVTYEKDRIARLLTDKTNFILFGMVGRSFFTPQTTRTIDNSFVVRREGKYLIVDPDGKPITNEKYDEMGYRGMMGFNCKVGGKWGFMKPDGTFLIRPQYDEAYPFGWSNSAQKNIAAVSLGGKWKLIDPENRVLLDGLDQWKEVRTPQGGLMAVKNQVGKWGYANEKGAVSIPARFDAVTDFVLPLDNTDKDPLAAQRAFVQVSNKWAIINGHGKPVSDTRVTSFDFRALQLVPASTENGFGYLDLNGNWNIEPQFESAGPFVGELAPAQKKGGKFGYIDGFGTFVIKPTFDSATPFYTNVAVVQDEGLWGVIDRSGNWVIPAQYSGFVGWGRGFVILVDQNGRGWYVNQKGKRVLEYSAEALTGKVGGKTLVQITLKSDPPKAKVYMIPRLTWERDLEKKLLKDADARKDFLIPAADTGAKGEVLQHYYDGPYYAVYQWGDFVGSRLIDVTRDGDRTFILTKSADKGTN